MGLRVEWMGRIEATEPLAARWDELALAAPQRLPMLSHAWIDAYAEALMPADSSLYCGLAFFGDRLVGVLPLVVHSRKLLMLYAVHSASTPYHAHSAFGDLVVAADLASDAGAALLASAHRRPGLRLRELALRGVSCVSPTATSLRTRVIGLDMVRSHRSWGSYLPVSGSWRDYVGTISRNFRANLRKSGNRLGDPRNGEARFSWLAGSHALPGHLEDFLVLEASGWKGKEGSAIGQDPELRRFYARLIDNLHRRGWLEWHFLTLDGKPVAGHLAVRLGRALVLLKIAYDESHAKLSPGALLFNATAERAFASGNTDEINCLTDMAWHRSWKMARREYVDARWYARTAVGLGLGMFPRRLVQSLKGATEQLPVLGRIYTNLRRW